MRPSWLLYIVRAPFCRGLRNAFATLWQAKVGADCGWRISKVVGVDVWEEMEGVVFDIDGWANRSVEHLCLSDEPGR